MSLSLILVILNLFLHNLHFALGILRKFVIILIAGMEKSLMVSSPCFFFFKFLVCCLPRSGFYRFLSRRSTFEDEHNLSNTVPVPKNGISANCSNYKPISILPVLPKVAEKLIFKPLDKYVESTVKDRLLIVNMPIGSSWVPALLDLTCHLQKNLDKGFECRLTQIYFSAAFDLVNHKALIYKLQNLGVGGYVVDLLQDFLTGRQQ